jgi:hypothetical protein
MENGERTETVKDGTTDLLTAMSEAMADIEAGEIAPSEEDCSAIFDWADDARSKRKPEDDPSRRGAGHVHRRSRGLQQGRLPVRRLGEVSEAGAAIQGAFKEMQSPRRLVTLRELTASGGPG